MFVCKELIGFQNQKQGPKSSSISAVYASVFETKIEFHRPCEVIFLMHRNNLGGGKGEGRVLV